MERGYLIVGELIEFSIQRTVICEICAENNHKSRRFYTDFFTAKFAPKVPAIL